MRKNSWNISDIKNEYNKLKGLINDCDIFHENKLYRSLISYGIMINNYYRMNIVNIDKYADIMSDKGLNNEYKYNKEYLKFLVGITLNLSKIDVNGFEKLDKIYLSEYEMKMISLNFYNILDKDFHKIVKYFYRKDHVFYIDNRPFSFDKTNFGMCFHDYISNSSYGYVNRKFNLMDLIVLNHEVAHMIELTYNSNKDLDGYSLFDDAFPYAIDYLFLNHLEKYSKYRKDVAKIKNNRLVEIRNLAINTLSDIKELSNVSDRKINLDDVYNIVNGDIFSTGVRWIAIGY